MDYSFAGFRQFLEEMDPTPEKERAGAEGEDSPNEDKSDYFQSIGQELGIPWDELVHIFEKEPWISTHFGLGAKDHEIMYKLSPWEIVKGTLTPHGADIRLKKSRNAASYLPGNRLNKSHHFDNRRYHLDREELAKFLTTGWTPAVQAAAGGPSM